MTLTDLGLGLPCWRTVLGRCRPHAPWRCKVPAFFGLGWRCCRPQPAAWPRVNNLFGQPARQQAQATLSTAWQGCLQLRGLVSVTMHPEKQQAGALLGTLSDLPSCGLPPGYTAVESGGSGANHFTRAAPDCCPDGGNAVHPKAAAHPSASVLQTPSRRGRGRKRTTHQLSCGLQGAAASPVDPYQQTMCGEHANPQVPECHSSC